jgi:hypothetical protein
LNPINVPIEQIGVNPGYYSLRIITGSPLDGLIINIIDRSEDTISVDVYTQEVSTTDNEFYIFDGLSIVQKNGVPVEEIKSVVEDILREVWYDQGYNTYNINANSGVPNTVDYVVTNG